MLLSNGQFGIKRFKTFYDPMINYKHCNNISVDAIKGPENFSTKEYTCIVFSSPQLKVQVIFPDRLLYVVRLSVCHLSVAFHDHIFMFFRTTGPISIKLGTKHPWVKGIQIICSNVGSYYFRKGDNSNFQPICLENLSFAQLLWASCLVFLLF